MPTGERLEQALILAAQLHANQTRKATTIPYITHLMGVASLVGEYGGTEEEIIVALLHDAVEDQGGAPTLQRIRQQFGDRIADMVDGLTDTMESPKPAWRQRKEKYLAKLATVSPSVRLVATADKLYNCRSIVKDYRLQGEACWERFSGGKEGSLWYYREIAGILEGAADTPLAKALCQELSATVALLENLTQPVRGKW